MRFGADVDIANLRRVVGGSALTVTAIQTVTARVALRDGRRDYADLLIFATGAKRTERRMQKRPGYRDYQQRVSFFFPRPGSR